MVQGSGGMSLTKKGSVMALTSSEAVQSGLARATVADLEAVKKILGPDRSWYMAWSGGQAFMKKTSHKKGQPPKPAQRQRELLPLPCPFAEAPPRRSLCRSVVRRVRRRHHWQSWANDGIRTLNALYGRDFEAGHQSF